MARVRDQREGMREPGDGDFPCHEGEERRERGGIPAPARFGAGHMRAGMTSGQAGAGVRVAAAGIPDPSPIGRILPFGARPQTGGTSAQKAGLTKSTTTSSTVIAMKAIATA